MSIKYIAPIFGVAMAASTMGALAAETQEFPVSACTTDNVEFDNVLKVKTIGDRPVPSGIGEELDKAWQLAILTATAEDVEAIGPIWSSYQRAIGEVSARHGVSIVAVHGGLQKQESFCFQPIGKPA